MQMPHQGLGLEEIKTEAEWTLELPPAAAGKEVAPAAIMSGVCGAASMSTVTNQVSRCLFDLFKKIASSDRLADVVVPIQIFWRLPGLTAPYAFVGASTVPGPPSISHPEQESVAFDVCGQLRRISPPLEELFETVVAIETNANPENYWPQVMATSTLADRVLIDAITTPAVEVSTEIIDAHLARDAKFDYNVLSEWRDGRIKATLGITQMVILGLRRALKQGNKTVRDFLSWRFSTEYQEHLKGDQCMADIETLRTKFRNPAAHGDKIQFSIQNYSELCELLAGAMQIREWGFEEPADMPQGPLLHATVSLLKNTKPSRNAFSSSR